MPKPAGPRNWDVIQGQEVDLDEAMQTLQEVTEKAAVDYATIREASETATLLGTTDKQRVLAILKRAARARDAANYWTRVLVEKAAATGATQRETATALGISTQTVNKWLHEPVGFMWNDVEDAPPGGSGGETQAEF